MRNLFPGFNYTVPSGDELSKLWKEAIFVFDTNMLLNIYRYSPQTRDRYFEILHRLKNQIWIPHQVAYEYQANRERVIRQQNDAYDAIATILEATSRKLDNALAPYEKKHGYIDPKSLIEKTQEELEKAKKSIREHGKTNKELHARLLKNDELQKQLEDLFQNKVGPSYLRDDLQWYYQQAERRFKWGIPPGWKDENSKQDYKMFGDVILWFQMIDYARLQKKPMVFVTDDLKEDWWELDKKQQPIKPRPELVQEMFEETGVFLYMYQGYKFLEQAEGLLNLEEKPDIIEEAKEIAQHHKTENFRRNRPLHESELAVFNWLKKKYPLNDIITDYRDNRMEIDFALFKSKSEIIGVEVKARIRRSIYDIARTIGMLKTWNIPSNVTEYILIVICETVIEATHLAKQFQEVIKRPENISVLFGVVSEGDFIVVEAFSSVDDWLE